MFTKVGTYERRGFEQDLRLTPIEAAHLGCPPKAGVTGSHRRAKRGQAEGPSCRARHFLISDESSRQESLTDAVWLFRDASARLGRQFRESS
jgi:hypothetical protein